MIRAKLPDAKIYYMSIKPSPSRVKYHAEFDKANEDIKNYLSGKPNSLYIDMNTSIYKRETNRPDSSLFEKDYLHLNSSGYDRWQKVLEPYVN